MDNKQIERAYARSLKAEIKPSGKKDRTCYICRLEKPIVSSHPYRICDECRTYRLLIKETLASVV